MAVLFQGKLFRAPFLILFFTGTGCPPQPSIFYSVICQDRPQPSPPPFFTGSNSEHCITVLGASSPQCDEGVGTGWGTGCLHSRGLPSGAGERSTGTSKRSPHPGRGSSLILLRCSSCSGHGRPKCRR